MMTTKEKPRKIGKTSGEDMAVAVKVVTNQNLSRREAARTTGIPFQTSHRYVKKAKLNPDPEFTTQPL